MSDAIACPSCRTTNPIGNACCRNCGKPLGGASWAEEPSADEGFVAAGIWRRPPHEFVRRVARNDLKGGLFTAGVTVPHGTLGLVLLDGEIKERLRPGFQTTEGVLDRFKNLFTGKIDRAAVYLVALRPMALPFAIDIAEAGAATKYQVVVELRIRKDDASLLRMIEQVVGDRDAADSKSFLDQIRPQIGIILEPRLTARRLDPAQRAAVEAEVQAEVQQRVGEGYGVDLSVRIVPVVSTASASVRVGGGTLPQTKKCVKCAVELEASKKFCGKCGASQPVMTHPTRGCGKCGAFVAEGKKFCSKCGEPFADRASADMPIHTADGQQVECDVVVRCQGTAVAGLEERVAPLVAGAIAQHVRGRKYGEIASAAGFTAVEAALRETIGVGLRAAGLEITDVTLVDIRSKGHEWLLGARAELQKALAEAELAKEWVGVEAQNLDVQAMTLELVLRSQRMDRDQAFAQDRDVLDDRARRQELLDRGAQLDVADAQRTVGTAIGLDAARRQGERAGRAEDHADSLTVGALEQQALQQTVGFQRTNETDQQRYEREREAERLRYERGRGTEEVQHQRVEEVERTHHELGLQNVKATHEMQLERQVSQHDAAIARDAMALDSERKRRELDDRTVIQRADAETAGHVARTHVDADAYGTRARGSANVEVKRSEQELELDGEARREQIKIEKMRALLAMDAEIAQRDAEAAARSAQQAADNELRARQLEAEKERAALEHQERIQQQLSGLTVEQMLAMKSSDKMAEAMGKKYEAEAMAIAKKHEAEAAANAREAAIEKELFERMLAIQATTAGASQAQLLEAMRMQSAQAAHQMQVLGSVTTAAVGGQREADLARQAAQTQGALGAVAMAERAMGGMAQVATAGAGVPVYAVPAGAPPGFVAAPVVPGAAPAPVPAVAASEPKGTADPRASAPPCPVCGVALDPGDNFCGNGHRVV